MKVKIFSAITTFVLLVSLLVVGVWALRQVDFSVTGEVKFEATGVEATISCTGLENGTLTEGTLGTDKLTDVKIDTSLTKTDLLKTFSPWQSLKLAFDEQGNDILLKLRITNDDDTNFINAEVSTDAVIATNCTVSALNASDSSTSALIYPGEYADFTVKLAIIDKYEDSKLQDFAVLFNLQHMSLTDIPTAESFSDTLTITCNESEETASVKAANTSITTANIPAYVRSANNVICAVTDFGEFENCSNLSTVVFSKNLKSGSALISCPNIQKIIVESPFYAKIFSFIWQGDTDGWRETVVVYVKTSLVVEGIFDENWYFYKTAITEENATEYGASDYVGYTRYSTCPSVWHFDNVLTFSFDETNQIATVTDANTSIEGVKIPYYIRSSTGVVCSVKKIGDSAFLNCTKLKSVTIPNSVTTLGYNTFENCSSLTYILIPDSVTSIDNYSFRGCSKLSSIVLGKGITGLGIGLFDNCTSLTTVFYTGTQAQYNNISGSSNIPSTCTIYYNFTKA